MRRHSIVMLSVAKHLDFLARSFAIARDDNGTPLGHFVVNGFKP